MPKILWGLFNLILGFFRWILRFGIKKCHQLISGGSFIKTYSNHRVNFWPWTFYFFLILKLNSRGLTICIEICCFWIKFSVHDRGPYRMLFWILFFMSSVRIIVSIRFTIAKFTYNIFFSASSRLFWGNAKLVSHQNSPWKLPKPSKKGKIYNIYLTR